MGRDLKSLGATDLDYFSENLGNASKELEDRFHQDIGITEERYLGR